MLFDSPVYFLFLITIVVLCRRLKWRHQNILLLAGSYFFYGWWDWRFLSLILSSTVVDFFCAQYIARTENPGWRRLLLTVSLVVNLTFLGFFKYFNFFLDSFVVLIRGLGFGNVPVTVLRIILPPGISFYTFQALAYIVDVYRKKLTPARSLIDYALFISFFPHLIAGPIQQPSHLLPQVQSPRVFDQARFFDGIMLILSGLFRKCVVANNCALLANAAFDGRLGAPSLPVLAIGAYAFAWQIYGDFSGYSDIARGSAQLLGFHFMLNFRQPYLAWSLQEFWRRWHISLSTWLRDYLFFPLSFWLSRKLSGAPSRLLQADVSLYAGATLITMLLGGLWHGANWTFVIWGGIHGLGLAIERLLQQIRPFKRSLETRRNSLFSVFGWVRRLAVFHLVCLSWIFFRAQSVGMAFSYLRGLGSLEWRMEYFTAMKFLAVFTVPLFLLDVALEQRKEEYFLERKPHMHRLAFAASMLILITFFSGNEVNAFIYFQF
jgi:D-alanyl-lipoteichoic acid acyltransferase DltB (MBOAT superfamily)